MATVNSHRGADRRVGNYGWALTLCACCLATSAFASDPKPPLDPATYGVFLRTEPDSAFEFRHPPEQWFPGQLYPRTALYNLEGGLVRLRLPLDEAGHPTDCAVELSSGVEELDRWSCFIVGRRGRFDPKDGEATSNVAPIAFVTVVYVHNRAAVTEYVCRYAISSFVDTPIATAEQCDDARAP